jgi:sarcosine oxidase/L-pipecolate oxidase
VVFLHFEVGTMTSKDSKILIVGGGTFGLSTGLWLLRNRFTNVTIIDSHALPSDISAGNDINKIIQSCYSEGKSFTNSLAIEALEGWQSDAVFYPHFHETGIAYSTLKHKDSEEYKELLSVVDVAKKHNRTVKFKKLETRDDYRSIAPQLTGDLKEWKGFYQEKECGWAHAKDALISAGKEIQRLGGKYVVGEVTGLAYDDTNTKVVGCKYGSGNEIRADKVIISAGASSVKILDFKDQLLAKCWCVGHLKLTEEEARLFKDMPVIDNAEKGFFFEPDLVKNELKVCNEFPGYTHYTSSETRDADDSIPIYKRQIPKEAEQAMRLLIAETLPQFKDRPLVEAKICWCTDTPDRNFLICEHPDYDGSLVLATGDSGHGFKHMPSIGKYIARLVAYGPAALDDEKRHKWRWRPETASDRVQDRYGGDGTVGDLKDVKDWTSSQTVLSDLHL